MSESAKVRAYRVRREDPGGADKLVIAAAQGGVRWVEQFLESRFGIRANLWDGPDGLGAVVNEAVQDWGIPNKRFGELVTPRKVVDGIVNHAGLRVVPNRKRRLAKK